jgi:hypothetical protein
LRTSYEVEKFGEVEESGDREQFGDGEQFGKVVKTGRTAANRRSGETRRFAASEEERNRTDVARTEIRLDRPNGRRPLPPFCLKAVVGATGGVPDHPPR